MNDFEELPNNPFLPGHPTSPDNFFSRKDDIAKITSYLPCVIAQGDSGTFFHYGKKRNGKNIIC